MGMASGRPKSPVEWQRGFWEAIRQGGQIEGASAAAGVSRRVGRRWFSERGGVKPAVSAGSRTRSLTFAEREDIAALHAQGFGVRAIARETGRDPGTISRELARVEKALASGGRPAGSRYRASTAQAHADHQAKRPKSARLATNLGLRKEVQERLRLNHSPEQISARLKVDFPDDPEMWVSHETIYQALYVQSRGALKRELVKHLRTGRALRKPQRDGQERRGRIPDMVNISERPAEVEDRAVPGDWEGDLIMGSVQSNSAIGTLVERATGFVMLLHLPDHRATTVADAMIAKMSGLTEDLRRTLTWDQGREMLEHVRIAAATGLDIYFCNPHHPWERGTNENTNGLLRQYFPKGSDLSKWGPGYLEAVATELNNRPRKRLGWRTPAEALSQLLSEQAKPPGVATTA